MKGSSQSERRVALVTGAGSGIGRAAALLLAQRGWCVALVGRRREALERVEREIADATGEGGRVGCFVADVGVAARARGVVGEVLERLGRLDALVNNAGYAELRPIDQTDEGVIRRSFEVNAIGPAVAIHAAWPVFVRQGGGCVVNVSTMGTDDPFPGFFAYAASKASVNLMARSCAGEGAAIGVRAFAVAPGAVETGMLRSLFGPEVVPPRLCLTPEEVGAVIVACITGERDADNGRTIFLSRGESGGAEVFVK